MSVNLDSMDGRVEDCVPNRMWAAIVGVGRCYEPDKVPGWDGCHDGQEWTPEQLTIMADRLEQTAAKIPILRALANDGGVKIS